MAVLAIYLIYGGDESARLKKRNAAREYTLWSFWRWRILIGIIEKEEDCCVHGCLMYFLTDTCLEENYFVIKINCLGYKLLLFTSEVG
jgi:hypothetical protein